MSDLISRQDAVRIVDQFSREEMFHYMKSLELDVRATQICHSAIEAVGTIKEQIEALPSADRPTGWIPVSERLPKEDGYYLVTWEDEDGRCTLCDYYRVQFGFGKCVKAWMTLPEPYNCGAQMGGDSE